MALDFCARVLDHVALVVGASMLFRLGRAWDPHPSRSRLRGLVIVALMAAALAGKNVSRGPLPSREGMKPAERLLQLRGLPADDEVLAERTHLAETLGRVDEAVEDWLVHGYPERAASLALAHGDHRRAALALYLFGDLSGANHEFSVWRKEWPGAYATYAEISVAIATGHRAEAGRLLVYHFGDPLTPDAECLAKVLTADGATDHVWLGYDHGQTCSALREWFGPEADEVPDPNWWLATSRTRRQLHETTNGMAELPYNEQFRSCGGGRMPNPIASDVLWNRSLLQYVTVAPLVPSALGRARTLEAQAVFLASSGNPEAAVALLDREIPSIPLDPRRPGDAAIVARFAAAMHAAVATEHKEPSRVALYKSLLPSFEATQERERDYFGRTELVGLRAVLRASLGGTEGAEQVVASLVGASDERAAWFSDYAAIVRKSGPADTTETLRAAFHVEAPLWRSAESNDIDAIVTHLRAHRDDAYALTVIGLFVPASPALVKLSRFELWSTKEAEEGLLASLASNGEHARIARAVGDTVTLARARERRVRMLGGDEPSWDNDTRLFLSLLDRLELWEGIASR